MDKQDKTSIWRDSMNKDYELKESGNSADNKLKQLYDGLLKDFSLSHNDCYVQRNPSLFVINESIISFVINKSIISDDNN